MFDAWPISFMGNDQGPPAPPYPADGWEVLAHMTAPVDNLFDFNGIDLTEYQRLVLLLDELVVDTDGTQIMLQLGIDDVLMVSGYRYYAIGIASSGSANDIAISSTSAPEIVLTGAATDAANASFSTRIEISNADAALFKNIAYGGTRRTSGGSAFRITGGGVLEQTGDITSLLISSADGLITAGRTTLYGVAKGPRAGSPVTPALQSFWVGALT